MALRYLADTYDRNRTPYEENSSDPISETCHPVYKASCGNAVFNTGQPLYTSVVSYSVPNTLTLIQPRVAWYQLDDPVYDADITLSPNLFLPFTIGIRNVVTTANRTWTLPTAQQLLFAMKQFMGDRNIRAGIYYEINFVNNSGLPPDEITFAAGAGIDIDGDAGVSGGYRRIGIWLIDVGPGTERIKMIFM